MFRWAHKNLDFSVWFGLENPCETIARDLSFI